MPLVKKSVVISGARNPRETGSVGNCDAEVRPALGPGIDLQASRGPSRGLPPSSRSFQQASRFPQQSPGVREPNNRTNSKDYGGASNQVNNVCADHAGIRPSLLTSDPTVSTGSESLDKLLGHGGLPLGSVTLVEESGTTDFASLVLRGYVAQGIIQNRLSSSEGSPGGATKCVVIGVDGTWASDIPGVYKSKKEKRASAIEQSVGSLGKSDLGSGISSSEGRQTPQQRQQQPNLKIAWRYAQSNYSQQLNPDEQKEHQIAKPHYLTELDFTSRMAPRPSPQEVEAIAPTVTAAFFVDVLAKLRNTLDAAAKSGTIVRIVIPSLLSPVVYHPQASNPAHIIPFIQCLRQLCRSYATVASVVISLSLELYPRTLDTVRWIELLSDAVVQLEAFPEEDRQVSASTVGEKPAQGLIHVIKLCTLSARGMMMARRSEYSFRAGRRQFEIQEWGIPVEDTAEDGTTGKNVDF